MTDHVAFKAISRSREGHHGDYHGEKWHALSPTPPLSRTLAAQLRRLALIEAYVRALEATDFAARLENLERANNR